MLYYLKSENKKGCLLLYNISVTVNEKYENKKKQVCFCLQSFTNTRSSAASPFDIIWERVNFKQNGYPSENCENQIKKSFESNI